MRRFLVGAFLSGLLAAQDPKEIVQWAIEADSQNLQVARNYTYLERDEAHATSGYGTSVRTHVWIATWDVMLLEGSPYRRLVARNDKPLSPGEQRREEEKLRKTFEKRSKETEAQRQKRIADWDRQRQKTREFNGQVPEAFNFRMAGEEHLDGAAVWVIEGTPRPGYRATTAAARALLPKAKCQFWIARSGYGWVKLEIEAVETISVGFIALRIAKGSRLVIEQTRVNDEVWLPKRLTMSVASRELLLYGWRLEAQSDFSDYKKFQAESRVVGYQEQK